MDKPILSICIPTRNRAGFLKTTLFHLTNDSTFLNTNKIEIVISDNCSDDYTMDLCLKFKEKYPDKIHYIRQKEDILDKNFIEVLKCAHGKYAKLNNDTLYFRNGELSKLVSILENIDKSVIFISGKTTKDNLPNIIEFKDFNEFMSYNTYTCTWIGGLCVKTEDYLKLDNPGRFSHLNFAQVDIIARLSAKDENRLCTIDGILSQTQSMNKKGGYNICEVFGQNFIIILQQLMKEQLLSKAAYNKVIKDTLIKHISFYHFDYNHQFAFTKGRYFKYLFKYYKFKPYYYLNYIIYLIKKSFSLIIDIEKDYKHKKIKILGLIKIKVKRKKYTKDAWKEKNKHNKTTLINRNIDQDRVIVGNGTYGVINAVFSNFGIEKLYIGNFCSIATNVKFIVSSEHIQNCLSTFPFKVHYFGQKFEAKSKGDIVVKDDVWIATDAIILSGVTIGQGAIIGAGAVVTKDVPPYAIVGGNPAKIIKYRFEPEIIEKLLMFNYSTLTEEKIKKLGNSLYTEITKDNVNELLEVFQQDA